MENIAMVLFASVFGYLYSGLMIASLHRYAHWVKLNDFEKRPGPESVWLYVMPHLAHHDSLPRLLEAPKVRRFTWSEWRETVNWAIRFALFDNRWVAIRTLIAYRAMQMVLLLLISAFLLGTSIVVALIGGVMYLLCGFACLVAYDMCHAWTHGGGPLISQLHIEHHRRPGTNFGMWKWHNSVGVRHMHWTIKELEHAEQLRKLVRL